MFSHYYFIILRLIIKSYILFIICLRCNELLARRALPFERRGSARRELRGERFSDCLPIVVWRFVVLSFCRFGGRVVTCGARELSWESRESANIERCDEELRCNESKSFQEDWESPDCEQWVQSVTTKSWVMTRQRICEYRESRDYEWRARCVELRSERFSFKEFERIARPRSKSVLRVSRDCEW